MHLRKDYKPSSSISYNDYTPDSIVQSIIEKFVERAKKGEKKYNTTLDRQDLGISQWIEHSQDELMDGILYLEKLKYDLIHSSDRKEWG